VVDGAPAGRAGIRKGDVVVALGETPIGGPADLSRRIASRSPGDRVQLTVVRDGARRTVTVELGRLPERGR
jgi:serine protease Do